MKKNHRIIFLSALLVSIFPLFILINGSIPATAESYKIAASKHDRFTQKFDTLNFNIEKKEQPPSLRDPDLRSINDLDVMIMPPVNVDALYAEDYRREAEGLPPRFALPIPVQITPRTSGTWEILKDGRLIWRLWIHSDDAISLNLGFERYLLPEGGKLFLYTPDYKVVRGPFTEVDNEVHGQFWSPILPGGDLILELILPVSEDLNFTLDLTSINHGYTTFSQSILSGACNVDVICPQGDEWRDEIRSVAVISLGGSTFCTGFLVNNTAQDLTPYFMTANHCGVNQGNAPSLVAYWNYENSWCRPVDDPINGQPGDGSLDQYNTGSIWKSSYNPSDFTLVQLDDDPDPAFSVHWAGWDRTSGDADWAIAIHHPNTDEKRISFEYDPTSTTSYLGTSVPGDGTHIRVTDWDLGTTEPGSSGSPLFNQEHRIIGQLHGGYAACYNDLSDWYGRFSISWIGGGTPNSRLSDWLDPLGSGVPYLDGRDLIETPFDFSITPPNVDICAPTDVAYEISVTQEISGFVDPVTFLVTGIPTNTQGIFSENPVIPPGTSVLSVTNTIEGTEGSYDLNIQGSALTNTLTKTIGLNLYTSTPLSPTLVYPVDGSLQEPLKPQLQWTSNSYGRSYNLEIDFFPTFLTPVLTTTGILHDNFQLENSLEEGRCYWWHVQSENSCGLGEWSDTFHFGTIHNASIFSDDMESGDNHWIHQVAQGADHWVLTTAQSHSPTHSWHVPDDSTITDSWLRTVDTVPIGIESTLSFWHRHLFESSYDGSVLEISINGGNDWNDLGEHIISNGYNGTINNSYENPLGGRQAWVDDNPNWTQVVVDLNSFAGEEALLRWRFGADSSVSDEGWYIDDVVITAPLPMNPPPVVIDISPEVGSTYLQTPVILNGNDFLAQPNLKLGDTWLISTTLINSTTIEAIVPAGLEPGLYDLTVYNGDCQMTIFEDAFTVYAGIEPIRGLQAYNDSPTQLGNQTAFSATLVSGSDEVYIWNFGDNSSVEGKYVTHTFLEIGEYMAIVTASNEISSESISTTVQVVDVPITGLTILSDAPTILGLPTTLTATVDTGTNVIYEWDFGGGETAFGATVAHTYDSTGTYEVSVTATNTVSTANKSTIVVIVQSNWNIYLAFVSKH